MRDLDFIKLICKSSPLLQTKVDLYREILSALHLFSRGSGKETEIWDLKLDLLTNNGASDLHLMWMQM